MVHNFVVHKVVYRLEVLILLAFPQFKHHRMWHLEGIREVDAVTTVSLLAKGGFLIAAQDLDLASFERHTLAVEPIGLRNGAFLLVEEEDRIHLVAFLGETELAVGVGIDGAGTVDRLAVDLHPLADFLHAEQGGVGQVAVGIGTHVEEEITAFGHDVA